MKVKTSTLEGEQLNYAVALAEGMDIRGVLYNWGGQTKLKIQRGEAPCEYDEIVFNYAGDWAQGGAIIERERIQITPRGKTTDLWEAIIFDNIFMDDGSDCFQTGTTPLEAAMRCYVASQLGDVVDIPEMMK